MHNWTRFALGSWTLVQAGVFKTTEHRETVEFYTHTRSLAHTHTTRIHTSCTYVYLIKGFGLILLVNCLLHPLFIANISAVFYASAVGFCFPGSNINFNNDPRIRIYV